MNLTTENTGDLGVTNSNRLLDIVKTTPHQSTMIDLGVRLGVSSRILMHDAEARGNHVHGIEAIGCAPSLADLLAHPNYHFIPGDSVTTGMFWNPRDKVRVLMQDTFHFAEHVLCELYVWWPHVEVGGWCVFHDTAWPDSQHDVYAGMTLPHTIDGVREFFKGVSFMTYAESFGMTFIRRTDHTDFRSQISEARWREIFAVRRKVLNAVNLPVKWTDVFEP